MKKWSKRSFLLEENNECLPNFEVFNENEFLETSNDLDDSEISLFIEENRNVTQQKRQKLTSSPLKKRGPLKKFTPRKLIICWSKSTNAQLLSVRNLHRYLFQNDAWLVIRTKTTELEVRLDC